MKRATVYLEDGLHRALKLKSAEADQSISEFVNEAVRYALEEDLEDLADIELRRSERTVSYEAFLKELRARGQI
jgi:hypothetical protein